MHTHTHTAYSWRNVHVYIYLNVCTKRIDKEASGDWCVYKTLYERNSRWDQLTYSCTTQNATHSCLYLFEISSLFHLIRSNVLSVEISSDYNNEIKCEGGVKVLHNRTDFTSVYIPAADTVYLCGALLSFLWFSTRHGNRCGSGI